MPKQIKKVVKRTALIVFGSLILIFCTILIIVFTNKDLISEKIINAIESELPVIVSHKKINISVTDHWPDISIQLKDLTIINRNNNLKKKPLFNAQIVSISFNALKLFKKEFNINEISIINGHINLETDAVGNINYDLQTANNSSNSKKTSILKIKKINLKNVAFDFFNYQKNKHIGFAFTNNTIHLNYLNNDIDLALNGEVLFNELLFNKNKGAFFKNKAAIIYLNFIYLNKQKRVYINNTSFTTIEDQKYNLQGLLNLDTTKQLFLRVIADIKDFDKTITVLPNKIQDKLSFIDIKNVIKTDVFILVKLGKEQLPLMKILFSGTNNNLKVGKVKVPYTDVSFSAKLLCPIDSSGVPNMEKATLTIKNIKGNIYNFPFTANVSLINLVNSYLYINGHLKIKANDIKFKPGKDFDLSGFCNADINYEGPAVDLNQKTFLKYPMKLKAQIYFDKFKYVTKTNNLPFVINGKALILNDSLRFNKLLMTTSGGDCEISGKAKGFTSYACNLSEGFSADAVVETSLFDITPLLHKAPEGKKKEYKSNITQIKNNSFEFNLLVRVKKLIIRGFEARNAIVDLHFVEDIVTLKKLNFEACNGILSAKGKLTDYEIATADIEIKNMDVNILFEQCKNFGQGFIKKENISGTISAKTIINVNLDNEFKIQANSLNTDVTAQLQNGHLINFESLQKISNYIFRKRNFKDITFSEINPKFKIKNNQIQLETMEVASNVLNFFVGGTCSFKDQSNLNITVPWNNLKSRGKNYIIEKHEEDKTSKGFKLNVFGYPGKLKVKLGNKKDSTLIE